MVDNLNEVILAQFEHHLIQISLSPKTITNYLADLGVFVRWAADTSNEERLLVNITPDQIRDYISYLLTDLNRAPSTINRHLQALRKCCAYLTERNLVPNNAAEEISLLRLEPQPALVTLSAKKIDQFLEAANGTRTAIARRDQAVLQLLVRAGLRITEIVNLAVDNVVFDYPGVHLNVQDSRSQGQRHIPLSDDVCRALKDYLHIRPKTTALPYLFLTQEGNGLSARTVQRIVTRCAKHANLSGVTAQLLRRTYAVNLLAETGDLSLVCQRLGHRTEKITRRYLGVSTTPM